MSNEKAIDMSKLIMVDKRFFLRRIQEILNKYIKGEAPRVVIPP